MRDPGSPGDLSLGVVPQGKKVAGRRCGKSIEAQPSFGQIKPREVAWDASPDSPGDGWRQAPPTHEGQPRPANSIPPTQASAGRYRSDLAPFLTSSARPCRSGLKKVPAAEIARARPNAPAAIGLSTRKVEQRSSALVFGAPCGQAVLQPPAPPGTGIRAPSRVRDQARQGRNGGAGSSEAEEPDPKGDAQLSYLSVYGSWSSIALCYPLSRYAEHRFPPGATLRYRPKPTFADDRHLLVSAM